uniref:Uncharacterized protein n=1 Tax=Nitzschia supralitorea TaxID=303403 RepID=A0A8F0WFI0_9STRA|nr:hypothetical protein KYU99_pgp001 [Nitzschia supralitorea]QWM93092.1 hypothetical protein [Nitzschia supralitorea]
MVKFKKIFSSLKTKAGNKLTNLKTQFKKNYQEVKSQPRSKRKSLFLGFGMVMTIFGVTLLTPLLSAVAKDVPKGSPNPGCTNVAPTPTPATTSSADIIKGMTGAAGAVCALAVSSGSFIIGIACGVVVVVGILKAQGK